MAILNWAAGGVALSLMAIAIRFAMRTGARRAEPDEYNAYKAVNAEKVRLLKENGDIAGTEKLLWQCNKRYSSAPDTYIELHQFLKSQNRHEEAWQVLKRLESMLRSTRELNPSYVFGLTVRQVHDLWHFKRLDEAHAKATAALKWRGRTSELVGLAIETAARLDDPDVILKALIEACAEYPDDLKLTERLFRNYVGRGDIANAEAVLVEAQSRFPQSIRLFIPHARLAHERADWEEAARRWAVIQERFVLNAEGFEKGAEALRHLGRDEEADAVMAQHPGHRAVPWPLT